MKWVSPRPEPSRPLSLLKAIRCSLIPAILIICAQPFVIFGIFGLPGSWWDMVTLDLNLDDLLAQGKFLSAFGTLLAFVRPTIPGFAPQWLRQLFPFVAWFFYSDNATVHHGKDNSSKDPVSSETFVYVNGICSTKRMALDTGAELAAMFNTDVTVVHNPTDSALLDLAECAFCKLWIGQNWVTSAPTALVLAEVMEALQDSNKEKVVLIAHSQGTIIAADVLWHLWQAVDEGTLPETVMQKLEMYNVANAAHWMLQRGGVPYIESIGNQRDNVAMLGALAPAKVKNIWNIEIEGKIITSAKPRWGHMISAHYLKHLKDGDYKESKLHYYMTREAPELTRGSS